MTIETLRDILNSREEELILDNKDKFLTAQNILKDDFIFFKLKKETALGLLMYIGIPNQKLIETYIQLINYENRIKYENELYLLEPDNIK